MAQERREFHRVPQRFEVQYRPAGQMSASWHPAVTLNLSAAGVRMATDESLEDDASVELKLQLPNSPQPLVVHGRVIWSQLQASGVCEIGVAFVDQSPEQQLHLDTLVQFLRKSV